MTPSGDDILSHANCQKRLGVNLFAYVRFLFVASAFQALITFVIVSSEIKPFRWGRTRSMASFAVLTP